MRLRYAFRLAPTPGQRIALSRAFGCARVVFNDAIAARRTAHQAGDPYPTDAALSKALTTAKRTRRRAWLAEVSAVVLQQALADANTAYRNFFASIRGERKGGKLGAPRFRSRRDRRQSIRFTRAARFTVTPAGRLRLPGIGDVAVCWSRDLPSEPSSVTVTVAAGRAVSGLVRGRRGRQAAPCDRPGSRDRPRTDRFRGAVGRPEGSRTADCPQGCRETAQGAEGALPAPEGQCEPAHVGAEGRRAHARVGDTRRDWLHKLSTSLIRENQAVYVEDLAVSGLARTRLARSVHDAGWSMLVDMLEYKARRHHRTFAKVDRWFPSTRMCSVCGAIGEAKPLHVRTWTCGCGAVHDRDVNAARNILAAGRAVPPVETTSDMVSAVRLSAKQEPTGSAA